MAAGEPAGTPGQEVVRTLKDGSNHDKKVEDKFEQVRKLERRAMWIQWSPVEKGKENEDGKGERTRKKKRRSQHAGSVF